MIRAQSTLWLAIVGGLLLGPSTSQAAGPKPLDLQPGQQLNYRVEKIKAGAIKVLGTSVNTEEKWIADYALTVGDKDDKGRSKVTVKVTHIEGKVPVIKALASVPVAFDDTKWNPATPLPAGSFTEFIAMKKTPLELYFEPTGKLAAVGGLKPLAAEVDRLLVKDFQNELSFANERVMYQTLYTDNLQKLAWDDLFVIDLPADFEVGAEWKERRLSFLQPFYVWMDATHLAEEGADGTLDIETTYNMLKSQQGNIKFANQNYDYKVKNGTGEGKFKLDPDGKVRTLDTTWHVYFDATLNAGGQKIPFDEFYTRLKYKIERKDAKPTP